MKTQRAHRRKLRFSSAKDASPVVSVKVECALKRPVKRRPRRASPAPVVQRGTATRHAGGLPTSIWSNIQERFMAAKSLGEITRTMLQFFKAHEDLQSSASGPVFPIFVPSSDIYQMKVPRKRRIYDVLHVLEGIGVIKRVRWDEIRKTKGGYFLYYGKAAVVQRLAQMKSNSAQVMVNFRRSCSVRVTSTVEEDSALAKVFDGQAAVEKWPCLVTTTVCFLGLLFQQDYQIGVALPVVSERLVEAKKFIGALVPSSSWNEAPYHDVQRRVYDVASVLRTCNLIITSATSDSSLESSFDPTDKSSPRKYVRFNYDIFTDPMELFATRGSELQKKHKANLGELCGGTGAVLCVLMSPTPTSLEDLLVSPPSAYWRSLPAGMALATSPILSPVAVRVVNAGSGGKSSRAPAVSDQNKVASSSLPSSRPMTKPVSRARDFFSPLGRVPTEKNEWYDELLKQLELHDALPIEDKIDWELNKEFKENYCSLWGSQYPATTASYAPVEMSPHQLWVDRMEVNMADLECQEVLDANTANFFC